MDPKKIMSYKEFEEFFSATAEFTTRDCGDDMYELTYIEDNKKASQLIYQPRIQTLLRKLTSIFYNFHNDNCD